MGCLGKGCLILVCFIIFLIIAGAIGFVFRIQDPFRGVAQRSLGEENARAVAGSFARAAV